MSGDGHSSLLLSIHSLSPKKCPGPFEVGVPLVNNVGPGPLDLAFSPGHMGLFRRLQACRGPTQPSRSSVCDVP